MVSSGGAEPRWTVSFAVPPACCFTPGSEPGSRFIVGLATAHQ